MSDETRRVLELLAQGKVTVEEAERLLAALKSDAAPDASAEPTAGRKRPRFVRVTIHKPAQHGGEDKEVNIRVPMAVVRSGIRLKSVLSGMLHKDVAERLKERGIDLDLSQLDAAALDSVFSELGDGHIDIDAGKAQVRISAE